jgi:hypothetical protein
MTRLNKEAIEHRPRVFPGHVVKSLRCASGGRQIKPLTGWKELVMQAGPLTRKILLVVACGLASLVIAPIVDSAELPDYLISKGGIIYPRTGDSSQEIFHTPPDILEYLKPGMLVGVLPEDCIPASSGSIKSYYICAHDLALKPVEQNGTTVYMVIDVK